ncbi:hypothetical protein OAN307_c39190 [Octadecabacter antarcticus 307]|uniref:Uncharacterized protein n=1 Tax=Octadecabacter antarcticus 307 TaxID=391626 RepID=M9RG12_9RHOB|nr:hypothetical protein OAN307_c39190 [Octadecabacter antarcticus 307]
MWMWSCPALLHKAPRDWTSLWQQLRPARTGVQRHDRLQLETCNFRHAILGLVLCGVMIVTSHAMLQTSWKHCGAIAESQTVRYIPIIDAIWLSVVSSLLAPLLGCLKALYSTIFDKSFPLASLGLHTGPSSVQS